MSHNWLAKFPLVASFFLTHRMPEESKANQENTPPKSGIKFDIIPLARTYILLIGSWLGLWGLGYYRFSPSWVALSAVAYLAYRRAQEKRALISGAMKAIGSNEKRSILDNIGAHELPTWARLVFIIIFLGILS